MTTLIRLSQPALCIFWLASCSAHNVTTVPEVGMEQEIARYVNQHRATKGLAALATDPRITAQCRRHCAQMAGKGEISHRGFSGRATAMRESFGHAIVAENVGMNYGMPDPARKMANRWISSEGHRQNIEGNYHLTGVGVVKTNEGKYFFSEIFVGQQ